MYSVSKKKKKKKATQSLNMYIFGKKDNIHVILYQHKDKTTGFPVIYLFYLKFL